MALSFRNSDLANVFDQAHFTSLLEFGKVAQLGTAPDSKSGKWNPFTRGFKSRPFLFKTQNAN